MVCVARVGHTTTFALGTLTKYQDAYDRQSKVKGQGHKLTSSVRLISASS